MCNFANKEGLYKDIFSLLPRAVQDRPYWCKYIPPKLKKIHLCLFNNKRQRLITVVNSHYTVTIFCKFASVWAPLLLPVP